MPKTATTLYIYPNETPHNEACCTVLGNIFIGPVDMEEAVEKIKSQ